jgi:DNA-directed RNA polymerase specialized sigma24 family protein
LRYFGGLSVAETAEVLGISPETAKRDWKVAKAWLFGELSGRKAH